ncbi:hypothetical protein MLD38_003592 [Melastoma candidum]|uniref:Uncharacterized protein n=1 Tax=Melastoma candidum TaxID=119954 RepID=A0ACB9S3C2_9MYRT|nr:hypothetical protein MLD38_003592 [Melastoma candidum]
MLPAIGLFMLTNKREVVELWGQAIDEIHRTSGGQSNVRFIHPGVSPSKKAPRMASITLRALPSSKGARRLLSSSLKALSFTSAYDSLLLSSSYSSSLPIKSPFSAT